jgi:hypothetical protein
MKVLNFRRTETLKGTEYAEILVVRFFFLKSVIPIYKQRYGSFWKFEKSGMYCHGHVIEKLAAKYDKETN